MRQTPTQLSDSAFDDRRYTAVVYVYRLESRPQKKRRLSDANDLNKRESPAAICDCRKDHPDLGLDPKEAKQITKRTIAALTEAVLEIEHLGED